MGLLSGLFNRRARDSTNGGAYGFSFGRSASGKIVTERTSMQVTAVYACVRVLSEAIASLPLHLYKYDESGNKEKAVKHPLYFLLHDEPNAEMTSYIMRETIMVHLLLWGNAYLQIIRNGRGEVLGLYPLMPDRMKVDRDENKRLYYEYMVMPSDAKTLKDKDSVVRLRPEDVLHIPGMGFDGLVGYSPIAMAKNTLGLSIAAEEYGSKFYENGATPSGVLEHPGVLKDPARLRDSWNETFRGSHNANKVAVLEEGVKYTPISVAPEDAQFLEVRKFQVEEIARIFRVPPHMIADLEHATFSNIESQSLDFVKYTLTPWVVRIEQAMNRALLLPSEKGGYFSRFELDGLLRGEYRTRMEGYRIGINSGIYSVNDVRKLEDMDLIPDKEGGNLHIVNGNVVPLKDAGAAYGSKDSNSETGKEDESQAEDPSNPASGQRR